MPYAKAALTALVSALGALAVAWDGSSSFSDVSAQKWLLAAVAVLGSTGLVWFTQNGPWHQYIKTVIAFLSAGIGALVLALDDNHITQTEALTALSAAIVATGLVFQVPDPAETRNKAQA
jgi:hypothetical protein